MYKRHLTKLARTRLDDVLIDESALDRARIEDAQAESEMTGAPLSHILFERQEIDEWDLAKIVARSYSLPFVDVVTYSIPREAEELLDTEYCLRHLVLPFDLFGEIPAIAVCEVPSEAVLEELEARWGHPPFVYVTLRSRLVEVLSGRGADVGHMAAAKPSAAPTPDPSPEPVVARSADPAAAAPAALPAAPMRLGFSMHRGGTAPVAAPLRSAVAAAPARPAKPHPAATAAADESKPAAGGKSAAWQSIFDLGDDAVG